MKACVIAAPITGSGKTTVTIGLLSALKARGFAVQPFKVGPDFIDPGLHELATGVPSHNLDCWMTSEETVQTLFHHMAHDKDVAIIEGVMGLFDGVSGRSNAGSTAEMAALLDVPVILVVDAFAMARSVAALIHGFKTFDPSVKIAGVILNRVAGEGHFKILADAIAEVPILGWLAKNTEIEIRERHLGLLTGKETEAAERIAKIRDFFAAHINIDRVLDVIPEMKTLTRTLPRPSTPSSTRCRVAIAQDPAFSFYYQANRDAMVQAGAEIVEFSIIRDAAVPRADFLYIGGGYPELYREALEANISMRHSVREFIESGKRFYAECGGLMYLAKAIEGCEMVGVIPTEICLTDRAIDFGYCEVTTRRPSILGPAGTHIRGHQFHYSKCSPPSADPIYAVRQGERGYGEGFQFNNGIASYVHLHFLSNPDVARSVLES